MNAAMRTPKKPLIACCTVCLRASRIATSTTPAPIAAQIAARSPATALARTNTITGRALSTRPRQPPIDSTSIGLGVGCVGWSAGRWSSAASVTRSPTSARTRG
jgi:hypothetical protein